jgi:hypothetical protein
VTERTPHLRRSPTPPAGNGRRLVIGVLIFLVVLIVAVVVPLVVIGLHNNGVKTPPGPAPHATQPS